MGRQVSARQLPPIHGSAERGFERVVAEFETNFRERQEVGAAFSVYHEGRCVVDIWAGLADRREERLWQQNTLSIVFSGSKGVVAACILLLLDRGQLELEAPVARYWPEFGTHGKEAIRVRDVLTHTARLPGIDTPLLIYEITDDIRLADLLAAQTPSVDPRAQHCYHAFTYGWLCGEIVRRVTGKGIGVFLTEEIATVLDLEAWIGLPTELESRVAVLELADDWPSTPCMQPDALRHDYLNKSIYGNPPLFMWPTFPWNTEPYHAAEIPAVNAIASARSLACLYGRLGELVSQQTLALARAPLVDAWDELHEQPHRYSTGFQVQQDPPIFGPAADAFGHWGAGGSCHGAWPAHEIGFSYVMNLMSDASAVDPRPTALLNALHECLLNRKRTDRQ